MKKIITASLILIVTTLLLWGCKKNGADGAPVYDVPTTYNFSNVDFSDATTRLGMLTEINNAMRSATTGALNAQQIKDMLANVNNRFGTAAYNTSGLNIKGVSALQIQTDATNFVDSLTTVSNTGKPAARGVAGIGGSAANPATKFALTANGYNYAQVFAKTMMSGFIIYQIDNLLTTGIGSSVNNINILAGSGTDLDHNWDLSFGYWGVPMDFPTNKVGAKFWGVYSTQVDTGYKVNKILIDAYIKGRAAIDHTDSKTTTAEAGIIMQNYEKLVGASALQAVRETKAIIKDPISLNSKLSEIYGFVYGLKYLPHRTITDAQIAAILALFPKNFYDVTQTDINNIRDAISTVYGFDAVKTIL